MHNETELTTNTLTVRHISSLLHCDFEQLTGEQVPSPCSSELPGCDVAPEMAPFFLETSGVLHPANGFDGQVWDPCIMTHPV